MPLLHRAPTAPARSATRRPTPRTRPLPTAAAALALTAAAAAPASADVVLSAPADVVEEQQFTVAYEATGPDREIVLFAKPAGGGASCAARPEDEPGTPVLDEEAVGTAPDAGDVVADTPPTTGRTTALSLPEPGTLLVCAYGRSAGASGATSRSTLTVHVRAARATIEQSGLGYGDGLYPSVGPEGTASFRLQGWVEATRTVDVRLIAEEECPERSAGGATVPPGAFDLPITLPVPTRADDFFPPRAGDVTLRRFCAWVQDGDEVEARISRPLNHYLRPQEPVCSHGGCHPVPPPAVDYPRLEFPRSRTPRLVRGRVLPALFGGRVVLARRGSKRILATAPISAGRFVLKVPRSSVGRRLVVRLLTTNGRPVTARTVTSRVR